MSEQNPVLLAPEILKKSIETMQQRGQQRDQPDGERSAADVAKCFNIMRKKDLLASDIWLIFEITKQVRSCRGEFDLDHYIDGAAYFSLRGEEKQREAQVLDF